MPLTARPLRLLAVLAVCLVLPASVVVRTDAQAQQPPTEAQLREMVAQRPTEAVLYLDLAKLYIEQGRFDDAVQMISNALALTRQQAPATSRPRLSGVPVDYGSAVRIGGDIPAPRKLRNVSPTYPDDALSAGVEGIVILEAVIDEQGNVASTSVIRSIPMLDDAAVEAVSQWQYEPTILGGQPRSVVMNITVNFTQR
jgi:protein TonB